MKVSIRATSSKHRAHVCTQPHNSLAIRTVRNPSTTIVQMRKLDPEALSHLCRVTQSFVGTAELEPRLSDSRAHAPGQYVKSGKHSKGRGGLGWPRGSLLPCSPSYSTEPSGITLINLQLQPKGSQTNLVRPDEAIHRFCLQVQVSPCFRFSMCYCLYLPCWPWLSFRDSCDSEGLGDWKDVI